MYTGDPIITMNEAQTEAEAFALKNGEILVAGDQEDALKSIIINYNSLRAASVLKRIEKMEGFALPGN